jgi:uncharacterized damage-inducible protein DinB
MYSRVEDFLSDYQWESESTRKVLRALTPESLAHCKAPGDETSICSLAHHLSESPVYILNQGGLSLTMPEKSEQQTVDELAANYDKMIAQLFEQVRTWKDEDLPNTANFFGMEWPKGLALSITLHHEIHHRGQLTAMMRNAGVPVPSIYGPNREETAEFRKQQAAAQPVEA